LLALYRTTREEELSLAGWGAAERDAFVQMQFTAQRQHYRCYFSPALEQVVWNDGKSIGRIIVHRASDEIRVVDIIIAPAHRNQGIGSALIRAVQEEARAARKPARLRVDKGSPSLRLYERLGFTVIGNEDVQWHLEWRTTAG
jgi:ribosomal protein S18 acetylase RimI-like enzyme